MKRVYPVVLALLTCLVLTGCSTTQLYGNLSEDEANAVLAALLEASIEARKTPGEEGAYAVSVATDDFARAMRILEERALPARRFADLGQVFGGDAMFLTPVEEKARYLYAMQEELAQTVASIDGVLTARVHLVLPEQDQLGNDLYVPSAAVFVRHVDDERHDDVEHRKKIRNIVAFSVPKLEEERIVVSFFPVQIEQPGERTAPAFRTFLGIRVAEESFERLRIGFFAACGAIALVAATAAFMIAKLRRKGAARSVPAAK